LSKENGIVEGGNVRMLELRNANLRMLFNHHSIISIFQKIFLIND
jgi:hypothetical protein